MEPDEIPLPTTREIYDAVCRTFSRPMFQLLENDATWSAAARWNPERGWHCGPY